VRCRCTARSPRLQFSPTSVVFRREAARRVRGLVTPGRRTARCGGIAGVRRARGSSGCVRRTARGRRPPSAFEMQNDHADRRPACSAPDRPCRKEFPTRQVLASFRDVRVMDRLAHLELGPTSKPRSFENLLLQASAPFVGRASTESRARMRAEDFPDRDGCRRLKQRSCARCRRPQRASTIGGALETLTRDVESIAPKTRTY